MHYYIIRPKRRKINRNIIRGIFEMDENAVIVEDMSEADICVLQDGWTRSRTCVEEYSRQRRCISVCRNHICIPTDGLCMSVRRELWTAEIY